MTYFGQCRNPRDERGWRIPRPNTKSRQIYELLVMGATPHEIAAKLILPAATVGVVIWRIRNPDDHNSASALDRSGRPRRATIERAIRLLKRRLQGLERELERVSA